MKLNISEKDVVKESTCSSRSLTAGHDVCHGSSDLLYSRQTTCWTSSNIAGEQLASSPLFYNLLRPFIL